MASSKGSNDFHKFSELPTELRCMIWQATWSPRMVRPYVWTSREKGVVEVVSRSRLPISAEVNRESREETFRHYELSFSIDGNPTRVYFNYKLDVLNITTRDRQPWSLFCQSDLGRVQNLSIPEWHPLDSFWSPLLDHNVHGDPLAGPLAKRRYSLVKQFEDSRRHEIVQHPINGGLCIFELRFAQLKSLYISPILESDVDLSNSFGQDPPMSCNTWIKHATMEVARFGDARPDRRLDLHYWSSGTRDKGFNTSKTNLQYLARTLEGIFGQGVLCIPRPKISSYEHVLHDSELRTGILNTHPFKVHARIKQHKVVSFATN